MSNIFYNADAKEGERIGKNECRCGNHRDTEVGLAAKSNAESDEDDAEEP